MYTLDYSDAILIYYLCVTKIIPTVVTLICDKCFNIKIKFRSVSLFDFCIRNIHIKIAGYEVTVGELGLRTKYLSSKYSKPLCVELEDVKISQTQDDDLETNTSQTRFQRPLEKKKKEKDDVNDAAYTQQMKVQFEKMLKYLLQFLPPTAMLLLQVLGIRIRNFSTTTLNNDKGPMTSLSVPSLDLTFDGCVVKNNRTLFIALALQHIQSKLYAYNKQIPSRKPHQSHMAELVVDFALEARFAWCERKLVYEKLQVSVNNTQVTFFGGLFDIIEHCMLHIKPVATPFPAIKAATETLSISPSQADVAKLIETLTPDSMIIHVEHTEVKSLNNQSSYHYHLLLQKIELKGKFKATNTSRMKVSNLRIYTPAQEVLHVKELIVDTKSIGNVVTIDAKLDTLDMVYNHDDIYGWWLKILTAGLKSNRKELILKALRMGKAKAIELYHSEFTQQLFTRIVINNALELRKMTVVFQLDGLVSSINASKLICRLNQSEEKRKLLYDDYTLNLILQDRHWEHEVIVDGPFCWYLDEKFNYLHGDSAKTYVRGSALLVGSSSICLGSHNDGLKLNLCINTVQTEYSQKLTAFTVESIKSFKQYIDLFSQLNSAKDEAISDGMESISIEKILSGITIDVKISNIGCFFINRHDVCTFVNLSEIASVDSFNFILDTLQVSTIDFSKFESLYDLTEFSLIHVSTKTLKINLFSTNDEPQVGVDFTEPLECSWNAHFLRHLLSLARDFHKFRKTVEIAAGISQTNSSLLPRSLPVGLDIKNLRNIRIKHANVNVDKLILLINELSGENLFFYNYFD